MLMPFLVIVTPNFLKVHNLAGPSHTGLLGTVVALYDIGCFVGAIVALWLGEVRRRSSLALLLYVELYIFFSRTTF